MSAQTQPATEVNPAATPPGRRKRLQPGTVVRVYRTSDWAPHWFYDPYTKRCTSTFSLAPYVDGVVADRAGNCYQVAVLWGGRTLNLSWMVRHWVRLPDEPPPTYPRNSAPRDLETWTP